MIELLNTTLAFLGENREAAFALVASGATGTLLLLALAETIRGTRLTALPSGSSAVVVEEVSQDAYMITQINHRASHRAGLLGRVLYATGSAASNGAFLDALVDLLHDHGNTMIKRVK